MGYHDAREIPNYWTYAQNFVLQDDMFEPNSSWSWPEHLFEVSAWSATCANWSDPMSCISAIEGPPDPRYETKFYAEHSLPWTDITYLLHKYGVSWRYYVFAGNEPDCEDDEAMTCAPVTQGPKTSGIWNPLVDFLDVKEDGQLGDVQSLTQLLYRRAQHERMRVAKRFLDHSQLQGFRTSSRAGFNRAGVCDDDDQLDYAQPLLGKHSDLPLLG